MLYCLVCRKRNSAGLKGGGEGGGKVVYVREVESFGKGLYGRKRVRDCKSESEHGSGSLSEDSGSEEEVGSSWSHRGRREWGGERRSMLG